MGRAAGRGKIPAYLEVGTKRVFAGAVEWPGWCRRGKTEEDALAALAAYGPRYEVVLRGTKLTFESPPGPGAFAVKERLQGDATTDFGAPGKAPKADDRSLDEPELQRFLALLKGTWRAFDHAVEGARGKTLTKGPRGGGRDLDKIVEHVLEADGAYLTKIGGKFRMEAGRAGGLARMRSMILGTFSAVACGEPIPKGPRGGSRWTPRYFVRRSAWHVLDHAWEIEDRAAG